MSLMIIKRGIPKVFRSIEPDKVTNDKGFLETIEKCLAKDNKGETSMLLASLISMRYKDKEMQKVPYASIIGSLMYAKVSNRLDLAYITTRKMTI